MQCVAVFCNALQCVAANDSSRTTHTEFYTHDVLQTVADVLPSVVVDKSYHTKTQIAQIMQIMQIAFLLTKSWQSA